MAKGRSVAIENGGKICVRIQIILNACKKQQKSNTGF